MDGTAEPVIAIIGHPIAGNPTQFALETGFKAAQIDCRVLSIDLPPEKVSTAIAGMDAMNFCGIWVNPSCADTLGAVGPAGSTLLLDFLRHEEATNDSPWTALSMKHQVWPGLAAELLGRQSHRCGKIWWIDERADLEAEHLRLEKKSLFDHVQAAGQECFSDLTVDDIEIIRNPSGVEPGRRSADEDNVIVWARSPNVSPQGALPSQSVILDLNENWDPAYLADWEAIKSEAAGNCLRGIDVHAACLSKLTMLLFDHRVDPDIFQDAIDEYLAV